MGNPYHDKIGRFTSKSGTGSAGPTRGSGNADGAGTGAAGRLNADEARGKGVENMWGVKATGRTTKDKDGKERPEYDFSERAKYIDEKLTDWRSRGIDTQSLYKLKNGEYRPERRKQQVELMEDIWKRQAEAVPNEGKALMAGGLGGAGKGFTLKNKLGIGDKGAEDGANYFTLNPDVIKEEMAKRGMIPKLDKKMTLMELSPLAHEEASEMAGELAKRAYAQKKNVVWDFTMSTTGSTNKRLDAMRSAGYDEINGMFVDVTVDKSIKQANSRWRNGLIRYANEGKGDGGRFLPSAATDENRPTGGKFRSRNRESFESVKSSFDGYRVYDNEVDGKSTLVDSKNDAAIGGG